MKLYELWTKKVETSSREELNNFLMGYYERETEVYRKILADKMQSFEGTAQSFMDKFGIDGMTCAGFFDGISTSIDNPVDLDKLEETTEIKFTIDWKTLYINMIKAKADWLQDLEEWNGIYSEEERYAIAHEYKKSMQAVSIKVGRNDPCPCGSGLKYKNCCMP